MRIGISTCAGDGGKSGISQYMIQLINEFAKDKSGIEFECIVYPDEQDIFISDPKRILPVHISPRLKPPIVNVAWNQVGLPVLCRKRGYDVLFLPAANRRICYHAPCPTVGTVHDFSNLHVKGKYDPARHFYITRALPPLIRRLNHVLTVSEASKKDIVEYAQVPADRVTVIYNGAHHQVYTPGDPKAAFARVAGSYGLRAPYLLYVSRIEHPGKNHIRLIHAFERLKASGIPHQLVLAGSDWKGAEQVHLAREQSPYKQDILFTGFLKGSDLPDLYRAADLLVFPSLYEGFGLPVVEAMASGIPVACSNLSSLPEIAGGAAELFDPYDPESIAAAVRSLMDPVRRCEYVQKGLLQSKKFEWSANARTTLGILKRAAGDKR